MRDILRRQNFKVCQLEPVAKWLLPIDGIKYPLSRASYNYPLHHMELSAHRSINSLLLYSTDSYIRS